MITLSKKLSFIQLRERAGFEKQIHLATRLSELGFLTTSASISAWELKKWKPKLSPKETQILCFVLGCTLDELAEAFEDNNEST